MSKRQGSITPETISATPPVGVDIPLLSLSGIEAQYQQGATAELQRLQGELGKAQATDAALQAFAQSEQAARAQLATTGQGATSTMQQAIDTHIKESEAREKALLEAQAKEVQSLTDRVTIFQRSAAASLQGNLCVKQEYHTTEINTATSVRTQVPNGPTVARYTIDEVAATGLTGTYAGVGALHPIEQHLFQEAVQELGRRPSAERLAAATTAPSTTPVASPNNVVLVDVFVRDPHGAIKQDPVASAAAGGRPIPETHTVALWQKKDREIVLIDPSNAAFTEHLVRPLDALTGQNPRFVIPSSKLQIYTPPTPTGPAPQPRDCIDIAVKIGFIINETQQQQLQQGALAIDEIVNRTVVDLTNKDSTYRAAAGQTRIPMPTANATQVAAALVDRLRQTSDRSPPSSSTPGTRPGGPGAGIIR
jgi:hypothetical protein